MLDRLKVLAECFFYCAMGLLGLTAVGAFTWSIWPEAMRGEKAADWFSAIGTIAAAVVAVAIALSDGLRRKRAAWLQAKLAASTFRITVRRMTSDVEVVMESLEFAAKAGCSKETFTELEKLLVSLGRIDRADIEMLIPLPGDCAYKLASGQGSLELAIHVLSVFAGSQDIHIEDERKKAAHHAASAARRARDMLVAASEQLEKVAFRGV